MSDEKEAVERNKDEAERELIDLSDEYARIALEVLSSDDILSHLPVIKTVAGWRDRNTADD